MDILLAFTPFLSFAVLERLLGTSSALAVAAAIAALLIVRGSLLHHSSLKLLEVGSMVLFGALAIASRLPAFNLSIVQVRLWVDGGLLAIVVASILVGHPFTLQYARELVPPAISNSPQFRAFNAKLSAVWAVAFTVIVAAMPQCFMCAGLHRPSEQLLF